MIGKTIGHTLGYSQSKREEAKSRARRKRSRRRVADIPKRPGTRGPYSGRAQGGRREELEKYAAQPKELGTLPERIWYKWLEDNGIEFSFQQQFGDIRFKGAGNLSDFFLPTIGNRGTIISVVGLYWHLLTFDRDLEMYQRLVSKGYRVVSSYEDEIYRESLAGTFDSYAKETIYTAGEPPVKITISRLRNVL